MNKRIALLVFALVSGACEGCIEGAAKAITHEITIAGQGEGIRTNACDQIRLDRRVEIR